MARARLKALAPGVLVVAAVAVAWSAYDRFDLAQPAAWFLAPAGGPAQSNDKPPAPMTQEAASPDQVAASDAVAAFAMPPAKTFIEIVRRPIFSPTRRPAPRGEITIDAGASALDLKLVGIIISSGEQIALVAPRGSSTLVRLTRGERFQGWTLELIEPQRVTFRRDEETRRIELSYDQPPPKPTARQRRKKARDKVLQKEQEKNTE